MKKKINVQFLVIAVLAITATWVFAAVVFYGLFQQEILADLKAYAIMLEATGAVAEMEKGDRFIEADELRISLIRSDGEVIFDSDVDIGKMENHADRPEVVEALLDGEASSTRRSPTLGQDTFYYARKMDDGSVLRLAKEGASMISIFASVIPAILLIAAFLFGLCMLLAHYLTRSLVTPIERMADHINQMPEKGIYRELLPVVQTIREQNEAILKSARMRQEFTANVTHELKTPLTAISGYSELIESGMTKEEDTLHFAKEIHRSSKRLLTLINDIIRLSELDATGEELPMEDVDLYALAQNCVDMLQMNAEKLQVTIELEEGEHQVIRANKSMMEEVVYNLCDNAIRYNNVNGTVTVRVAREKERVILSVRDTGIGIPKEHQERIFERFYRVDKSRSKSTGGTGLGLAIVKHIVAQQGAELQLESQVGVGTEIRVVF